MASILRGIVHELRKSLGMSLTGFAAAVGASESSVRNWENGRTRPAPAALKKMREMSRGELTTRIDAAMREYEWHPGPRRRFSRERIHSAHLALDLLFDRATSAQMEKILELLDDFAVKYGSPREESETPATTKPGVRRIR